MHRGIVTLSVLLLTVSHSAACSIPVFRYALERWTASKYELVIFHDGPFSPEDQVRIKKLREQGANANILVNLMDISSNLEPNYKKLWERDGKNTLLPHAVLRYPEATDKTPAVWSGPLGSPKIGMIIESPGRQQIFDRLTAGDTAAVVLLLSKDAAENQAAREFLANHIPAITKRIVLPAQSAEGPQIKSALPLDVRFRVIELERDGPESMLANMLLHSEEDLANIKSPVVFPVYGRGRALCSIHGDGLKSPEELQQALEYVCRACSCQVKELNPGVDLLIDGDWDEIFLAELGPMPRESGGIMIIEQGPPPRKLDTPEAKVTVLPKPKTPLIPEYRKPPEPTYKPAELRTAVPALDETSSTKTYLLAIASVLVLMSLVWAWRSHQQNLQNLE